MKNNQMSSVKDGDITKVLPTVLWQQAVQKTRFGSTARAFIIGAAVLVMGAMLSPTASLGQKKPATTKAAHAKLKKKKKVKEIVTVVTFPKAKEEEDEEEHDGPQERLDYEFNRTKDPTTNTVPKYKLITAFSRYNQSLLQQKAAGVRTNGVGGAITNGIILPVQTTPWIERGPTASSGPGNDNNPSTSGRADAYLADLDPSKPNQVFVGGNDGGLWKCPDITQAVPAWTFIDNFANIAISNICQDPTNPDIIYFGTGDKLSRLLGGGIWKSTDHGVTFSFLASTTTFYNITKVLCDNNGYLYAGMVQFVKTGSDFTNGGLVRSTDGGATWTDITPTVSGINSRQVSDMVYDASINMMGVYMGYQYVGEKQGYCYASPATVTASTWLTPANAIVGLGLFAQVNTGSPQIRQTVLSAKGGVVWALQGYLNAGTAYTNLYLSTDAGATWTLKQNITSTLFDAGQNWYALAIDCDPQNPGANVVIGGLNPFRSTNGGNNIAQIARWTGSTQGGPNTAAQFVHADIHKIIYNTNASGLNRVICMDDGGINYSDDGGTTWRDRNTGLRTVEFYSCAANPSDPNNFLGGAQDNGSHQFIQPGLTSSFQVSGGDGAFTAIDQLNPNNQITAYTYNQYYVATDKGVNLNNSFIGTSIDNTGQFINPFDFDAKTKKMYASTTAGQYLRWDDPLTTKNTYPKITVPAIGANTISAITVSPSLGNTIYLAAGGIVVKAANANTASPTFTTITPPTVTAGSNISSIVVGPSANDQDLIVTSSSYGTNKVFISANGGSTWTDITGNLPDMPVNWSCFYPGVNNQVYLATSLGVWYTTLVNGAATAWQADVNIPKAECRMIKYNEPQNTLVLATYGRGLWTAQLSTNPKISFSKGSFNTSKSFGATTNACRVYQDYIDTIQISGAPTGTAVATITAQPSSTAVIGADSDIITPTVTFASAIGPAIFPVTIRVYKNKNKNIGSNTLTANLGISVAGSPTTDAVAASTYYNALLNFTDSSWKVPTTSTSQATIFSEDWETGSAAAGQWVFAPFTASAAIFTVLGEIGCGTKINGNYSAQTFGTNASASIGFCQGNSPSNNGVAFYKTINAQTGYFSNMNVTFNYFSRNNTTNTNTLSYSLDGGTTWVNIGSQLAVLNATTNVTINLPTVLNNTNFILGWRSVATTGTSLRGFSVDDIVFKADINPPAIETTVSSASNYYVNSGTNIDAFSTNNNIFANITNPSADLGCVTASIENAGNGWVPYLGGNRSVKTFLVTPSTNASGTTYSATFYFTNAELASISPANLKLAKTEDASVATSTAANTVSVTTSNATYSTTGVTFTGTFTGFSRYFLIDQSVVLPISLVSFTGSLVGQNTVLDWVTASETNNKEFDVQWGTDGTNFATVGIVPSKGNSTTNVSYTFTHDHPSNGINYYRLKQIDKDGTTTNSSIVTVRVSGNDATMPSLYPNPAQKSITLNMGSVVPQADMALYSIDMRLLRTQNLVGTSPTTTIDISQLPAGVYFMQVNKNGNKVMLRFVKE